MSLKRACEAAVVIAGVALSFNTENAIPESGDNRGANNAEICRVRRSPIVDQLQKSYRGFLLMRAWQEANPAQEPFKPENDGEDYPFDTGAELSDFEAGFFDFA